MKALCMRILCVLCATSLLALSAPAAGEPPAAKDLNTPRQFPDIQSKKQWQSRAEQIRQQVLVSCGLWPLPQKTELNARVFDRVERDGYSIEKVYFQSYPGVYVGGNLYRPLGKGKGPFPAVLNPHGHWSNGRMADNNEGSLAARGISQARMGMVAFTYDMAGYNDTFFPDHGEVPPDKFYVRHRRFATNAVNQLWGLSQMGLQTWNSIRALDFLESLPDVDRRRLACTGESGGGTQTFMLGAIDDRLAVVAPVVMVSHSMQGGCSCENAPGLRVEHSNMEIAAAAAPTPQIMVGATGDWTKTTLTIEGPAVARMYELLGARDKVHYVRYDFGHNYNRTSREAVYGWFNRWLLGAKSFEPVPEPPYTKEPDSALRVFPDSKLPADAVTENQFIQYWNGCAESQWRDLVPTSKASLARYRKAIEPVWQHSLQLDPADSDVRFKAADASSSTARSFVLKGGTAHGLRLQVTGPGNGSSRAVAVLAYGGGSPAPGLKPELLASGWTIVEVVEHTPAAKGDPFANFYTVYNRTRAQEGVRDLVRACGFARGELKARQVVLVGQNAAGPWALLAAPAADAVLADCNQVDTSSDEALLHENLFSPGLRRMGGFEGAALLAAPRPLYLHNTGTKFATAELGSSYASLGAQKRLVKKTEPASVREIVEWAASFK